ncbi:MAG TPA: aldolase [Porphyromonadaceae bacterium]|nr:aldolase [Porphyromonadaceae bacterium]
MDNNQIAFDFALHTNRNLFITGKAGTGKTTFLHRLKEASGKQMAVVAPTGVAAINAGGTTIHSFFQLPLSPFFPTPEGKKDLIAKARMRSQRRRILQELELLVIDEISMVRADLLDAIDHTLRYYRYRPNEPFGGVQVIFIGDMFQLSPVVKDDEWELLSQFYPSPYFFHSLVIAQRPPVYIEFEKIYRQTNADFIRILNEVRNDSLCAESLQALERRYDPSFVPPEEDNYITLTTHNYKADLINSEELAKIKGKTYIFDAEIEGAYPEKSFPTEQRLELKIGAKVMFLKNDTEMPRRFFNGKIGVVDTIDDDHITVRCGEDELIDVETAVWEDIRYTADPSTKQIEEKVAGRFKQYPLRLAWAITIHKSQGLTFDKAVIDAGQAFAPGQVYVALSRCRSLEGVVLLSKIHPESIHTNRRIVEYGNLKQSGGLLEKQLDESRKNYRLDLLLSVFDFSFVLSLSDRLVTKIREAQKSFNEETGPYVESLRKELGEIQAVAVKFQTQLRFIFRQEPVDEAYLLARLEASEAFFSPKLRHLEDALRQSPAVTDSRAHAEEYNEAVQDIFSELMLKKHLLARLKEDASIDAYFDAKNRFKLPDFKVNAYAAAKTTKSDLSFPELYYLLAEERNKICEPLDLPIYMVAASKTLYEMAEYLPQNEDELLQISGFGPAKVEKYGSAFLSVIGQYCEKHHLESRMAKKEPSSKKKKTEKTKKPKGGSGRITLEMYLSGRTITEIATERKLAVSTVGTHLAKFVETGELRASDLVPEERLELAEKRLASLRPGDSLYHALKDDFSTIEIMMIVASRKTN